MGWPKTAAAIGLDRDFKGNANLHSIGDLYHNWVPEEHDGSDSALILRSQDAVTGLQQGLEAGMVMGPSRENATISSLHPQASSDSPL